MRNEVIRYKVFPMLTVMIILMTLGAFSVAQMLKGVFGVTSQSIAVNVFSNIFGVLIITFVYFALFIVAFVTAKVKYINLISASIFALFTGGVLLNRPGLILREISSGIGFVDIAVIFSTIRAGVVAKNYQSQFGIWAAPNMVMASNIEFC